MAAYGIITEVLQLVSFCTHWSEALLPKLNINFWLNKSLWLYIPLLLFVCEAIKRVPTRTQRANMLPEGKEGAR